MTGTGLRAPFSFDPVEFGRGVMVSSAYRGPTLAVQVHVLRLRAAFERAGMAHRLSYVLSVLSLMREVQELANGFWFPTPLRKVDVGDRALVVGPHPTAELRRHFPELECAGYARFSNLDRLDALPSQELHNWSGLDVSDTRSWMSSLQATAPSGLGPTLQPEEAQFFALSRRQRGTKPLWMSDPRLAAMTDSGLVFCRAPIGLERWRYFWGLLDGTRVSEENPVNADVARIQFGLAAILGLPLVVTVLSGDNEAVFQIPCSLPRPETRLLLGLGTRDFSLPMRAYRVRGESFGQVIATALKALGCELRFARA